VTGGPVTVMRKTVVGGWPMRSGMTDRLPLMRELDDARCPKHNPAAARSVEKHQRAGLETATAPTEESERASMSIFKLRHYTDSFSNEPTVPVPPPARGLAIPDPPNRPYPLREGASRALRIDGHPDR
jgi:hypothetical protein